MLQQVFHNLPRRTIVHKAKSFRRPLQSRQLAVQKHRIHILMLPQRQPPRNQLFWSIKKYKLDMRRRYARLQGLVVLRLQRRTREHTIGSFRVSSLQQGVQCLKPWSTVLIGQRMSSRHLLLGCRGKIIVGVSKGPTHTLSKKFADRGLSGSAYAHHYHNHSRSPSSQPRLTSALMHPPARPALR